MNENYNTKLKREISRVNSKHALYYLKNILLETTTDMCELNRNLNHCRQLKYYRLLQIENIFKENVDTYPLSKQIATMFLSRKTINSWQHSRRFV